MLQEAESHHPEDTKKVINKHKEKVCLPFLRLVNIFVQDEFEALNN